MSRHRGAWPARSPLRVSTSVAAASAYCSVVVCVGIGSPALQMPDDAAKIFASLYALFGGAVYPALTAILLYPFLHRMLRVLHLEALERDDDGTAGPGG